MPELPDVVVYVEALQARLLGKRLLSVRLKSSFLLRTVEPPLATVHGKTLEGVARIGKRIVLAFEGDVFCVLHLMIAGRLQWSAKASAGLPGRIGLAAFDFESGTLLFTEASSKQRASLHVVVGKPGLADFDRGGLEPLTCDFEAFKTVLRSENHTLKRALTDPTLLSGIGNAYSDEILHAASLSPLLWTARASDEEMLRLYRACQEVLSSWTARLRAQSGGGWPKVVTAFRDEMAVHGRFGQPCPRCATAVQRIVYAENETNYCPNCQTGGRLLADRALSTLLRGDWPKTLAEMEDRKKKS